MQPLLTLLLALAAPAPPAAVPRPAEPAAAPAELAEREFIKCLKVPPGRKVRLNFKSEMEITEVIGWIASVSCKNFLLPTGLNLAGRKVMVIAPREVAPAELYRLFVALLESVNLTLEPAGGFLRVIEPSRAARADLPLVGAREIPARNDGYVTQLLRVAHADINDVASVLNAYRSEHGSIVVYPPSSTLIITDRVATIDRLKTLIAALDLPGEAMRLWPLPVRHLDPADLAATLGEILAAPTTTAPGPGGGAARGAGAGPTFFTGAAPSAGGGATPPASSRPPVAISPGGGAAPAAITGVARMIPDPRTGRLLVVATEAAFARVAALAARLDVPVNGRAGQVHAYRCRHADCDAVASILSSLTGLQVARGPNPDAGRVSRASARPGAGSAAAASPGLPSQVFSPPGGAASAGTSGGNMRGAAAQLFSGEVRVTSDPSTNALLVLASLDDFRVLRRLIEEMDVPRKQVFIEATIMEVLETKDREAGFSFHGGASVGGDRGLVLGGVNAGRTALLDAKTLGSALVGLSGLAVGAPLDGVAQALGLPAGSLPSVGALIQLLQTDSNVDLVANPQLLITNNQQGRISVGQRVPFQGAFLAGAGATAGAVPGNPLGSLLPNVSINREDVALTLTLTPHVNEDDEIRLEIDQEMSEIAPGTDTGFGPTTTQRTTQTTVIARDQQTLIISGLMRNKISDSASKVPFLGDIPVLGFFFRRTRKVVEKQNIIIALTPYVVKTPSDLLRVLEAKLRDRRELIQRYGDERERRLLAGPLGLPRTVGMLERMNRAVKEVEDAAGIAAPAPEPPPPTEGLPLPGS
jgi:general secretion pathway protein D